MLSFELSVIDIVLVIAIVTLLLLYITKISSKHVVKPKLTPEGELSEEPNAKIVMSESSSTRALELSVKCPRRFGYLKTLPLGSSVPDECYNCPRMMQCLFHENQT
jgi:hypothetical protein